MFQGHKSKPAWNVSLYLFNDESLYNLVKRKVRSSRTLDDAADNILDELRQAGITSTPDGYRYTKTSIRLALENL